jgi:GTPase SAR1 family protein
MEEENIELTRARDFIEHTGTHLFLTGKAGTGKTTFLRNLKRNRSKRMIVVAPTGIAAINAGGVTIHSFFQLPFAPHVPDTSFSAADAKARARYRFSKEKVRILRSIDLLVIDEISMVRADLLDAVDEVLQRYRRNSEPFGGVQLLMIGDLQQLAPVVKDDEWMLLSRYYPTPYFFSSRALSKTYYCTIELRKVYRQSDNHFLDLLNRVRENRADNRVLEELNQRCIPHFLPPKDAGYIRLVTHNYQAQRINEEEMEKLTTKPYSFRAKVEGSFPELSFPTEQFLELKKGAQVMFVKNDSSGEHRYYNGMIGKVVRLAGDLVEVLPQGGDETITVKPEEWANTKYVLNEETKEITEAIEGVFRQYPLKPAWAITIHKSQGLTFAHAIIDASGSFAHGQTYVALSRCKTLEGMVLSRPLTAKSIINDPLVEQFTVSARQSFPQVDTLLAIQRNYFIELLQDLFNFNPIASQMHRYVRIIDEYLYKRYPKLLAELKIEESILRERVTNVSLRFARQYQTLVLQNTEHYADDPTLQERIRKGAAYFEQQLRPLKEKLRSATIATDNKELKKQLKENLSELMEMLRQKKLLLLYVSQLGFQVNTYLKKRALTSLSGKEDGKEKKEKKKG